MLRYSLLVLLALSTSATTAAEPHPVIIDAALGHSIDDAFVLALLAAAPEVDLLAVTAVGKEAETSAFMACRLLTAVGRREVPVAWGRGEQPKLRLDGQTQYRNHPALIFKRMAQPVGDTAIELLHKKLANAKGKVTILTLGPVTNIAQLLTQFPADREQISQLIVVEIDQQLAGDAAAAKAVLAADLPLTLVLDQLDKPERLAEKDRAQMTAAHTLRTFQLQALMQLAEQPMPTLCSLLAASLCVGEAGHCGLEERKASYDDTGRGLKLLAAPAKTHITTDVREKELTAWAIKRLTAGDAALPKPPGNRTTTVAQGKFPARVHAFEDFETDIEARWWMSGKLETKNVPPGAKRACRGVLTQDFDDRQGDLATMYNAVVFNPVPGPPMGPRTRLSFRYWLRGAKDLRVQLYSLTNGYHRYLSLTDLPQEKWHSATVDMTAMRRPDGTGGPLSENERIDDIQFYADPRAELLIDDMILYEAAADDEQRPFPSRVIFTGWFDTGKQGKEWPGKFEIVDKAGSFWKAAQSIPLLPDNSPGLVVSLRGERPISAPTHVSFRYKLTGARHLTVALRRSQNDHSETTTLNDVKMGEWQEHTLAFPHERKLGAVPTPPALPAIDEVFFSTDPGSRLLLDDLLLFEPGKP